MNTFREFLVEKIVSRSLIDVMMKDPNVKTGLEFEMILSKSTIRKMVKASPALYKRLSNEYYTKKEYTDDISYEDAYVFAAEQLKQDMGWKVNINSSYHSKKKALDAWTIEEDGSLSGDDWDDIGMELVSPPLQLGEMIKALDDLKAWMKKFSVYTNESTGLHINVSVGDAKSIDPLKLVLMGGFDYESKKWGREDNEYAMSIFSELKDKAEWDWDAAWAEEQKAKGIQKMAKAIKAHMPDVKDQKFYQFNMVHKGHVEFRFAGGKNYEKDMDKIKSSIYNAVSAYVIAKTPELYKEEYYKKIYKLFHSLHAQSVDEYGQREVRNPERVKKLGMLMKRFDATFKLDPKKKYKNITAKAIKTHNFELDEYSKSDLVRYINTLSDKHAKKLPPKKVARDVKELLNDLKDHVEGFGMAVTPAQQKWMDLFASAAGQELVK